MWNFHRYTACICILLAHCQLISPKPSSLDSAMLSCRCGGQDTKTHSILPLPLSLLGYSLAHGESHTPGSGEL